MAVNRIWSHLFGRGLVATPDDFGVNGSRPSHPELLDHLAREFVADGWSIKRLIRRIVLSRTYQLSSEPLTANQLADPDNVLLWRMRPRRLEAEAIRDTWLSVSGELRRSPPVASPLAQLHPIRDSEFNSRLAFTPEQRDQPYRSVYTPVVRGELPEIFELFDFADPSVPTSVRDETTVPTQATFLLNSPWMIERSRRTAERILAEYDDDAAAIDALYRLVLGRPAESHERERMMRFLQQSHALQTEAATAAEQRLEKWTSICQSLLSSTEFFYLF